MGWMVRTIPMAKIDKKDVPERFDYCFIDADILKYSAGFAAEKTYWHLYKEDGTHIDRFDSAKSADNHTEELWTIFEIDTSGYYREPEKVIGTEEQAIKACDTIVSFIKERVKADHYKFYLSGKNNFRNRVATLYEYGHNRKNVAKPHWIDSIVDHLIKVHGAVVTDGIEGDDQIGVGMMVVQKKGKLPIHAGIDKDVTKGISGYHFDFKKDEFVYTSPEEALLFNYVQGIAGDQTDGFHGIPKVGLKKAARILEGCETEEEMYKAAVSAYKDYFGEEYTYQSWNGKDMTKTAEELFLENMTLAWIMKEKDRPYTPPHKRE